MSYKKEWEKLHPDKVRATARRGYEKLREAAFDILGRQCVRCGFDDIRALQVDHVNGGGWKQQRGWTLYRSVLKDPEEYQTLCANCNWIKRHENKEYRQRVSDE